MDKGKLVAEDDTLTLWELDMAEPEFTKVNQKPFASPKATKIELEIEGENTQHVGVINAWGGAILRGEEMIAHGAEGINGLMLSNAMHLSSWLDQAVELPIDEDLYCEQLQKRVATSRTKTVQATEVEDLSDTYAGN